jgi:hypothetical protein
LPLQNFFETILYPPWSKINNRKGKKRGIGYNTRDKEGRNGEFFELGK